MVRHAPLREIVSPDLFRAVACTDLASAHLRLRIMTLLLLDIIQLCFQQRKSLCLVLQLRLLCLAIHNDPCRIMRQPHCRVCRVHALPPVSRRPHDIDSDVLVLDHNINIVIHLRHHCHTDRGSMDPSA